MNYFIKNLLLAIVISTSHTSHAQLPRPDTIATNMGNLVIQPIFHGALVLKWNGKTIYIDPYNGAEAYKNLPAPDLILITDIHPDHLDLATLNALNTSKAQFIVPQAVAGELPPAYSGKVTVVNNDATTIQAGITITAIPMYNLPETPDTRHPKGRGNGYVLQLGNKRLYISGDTGDIPEMRSLKNIHIAFVCMNLPYTMSVEQAASAVLDFKPQIVYPYHFRGKKGFSDTRAFKTLVNNDDEKIEVRLKDWYMKN